MELYSYDQSGLFLGVSEARQSPLEPGVFLIPAHATIDPPPALQPKQAAVFVSGQWAVFPDHRGETWYAVNGDAVEIDFVGDPLTVQLVPDAPIIPVPAPLNNPPSEADYAAAIQRWIDGTAQTKNYDDALSCARYALLTASPPGTKYKEEGQACVDWTANVWAYAYTQLAAVQAGQRSQPTIAEFMAELPQIIWP